MFIKPTPPPAVALVGARRAVLRLLSAAVLASCSTLVMTPPAYAQDKTSSASQRMYSLVVLRDETVTNLRVPSKAVELVRLANGSSDASRATLRALSSPVSVRLLISERPPEDYVSALKPGTAEYRLLNYVVLQYADAATAKSARQMLNSQQLFRSAEEEVYDSFSAAPNDPYFAPAQSSPLNKQWGMSALNLPAAWDTQNGYAYIGVVDNGIQRNHPDLMEDRTGNVRAHFSGSWNVFSPVPSDPQFDESYRPVVSGQRLQLGHGSHVAGIIAATTNNATGVSGACQNCALAIAKASDGTAIGDPLPQSNLAGAIYGMVRRGVQSINLSLGNPTPGLSCGGAVPALPAYCDAIQFAADRDIVIVAAAGNSKTILQFPASDSRTFSVGGYQSDGNLWDQTLALGTDSPARTNDGPLETGTNYGSNQLVVAPARDILSTMYTNRQWATRCGSVTEFDITVGPYFTGTVVQSAYAGASGNLYGICTGTSMAAPHITGLVGLIRSTNPLLTTAQVRSNLQQAAGGSFISTAWGYGLPNAAIAVSNALSNQRLTPLFAFYNSSANDYAYTVFPQMGAALNDGAVPPFVGSSASTGGYYTYSWIGNTVAQYPTTFAGVTIAVKPGQVSADNYRPRAKLNVFTTPRDGAGTTLWPICRFSYVVSSAVRHVMDTSATCAASAIGPGIAILDGQEGYVYPPNQAQPAGTEPVIRMEMIPSGGAPTVFVLTAMSDQAYYIGLGFFNPVVLGYAYLH